MEQPSRGNVDHTFRTTVEAPVDGQDSDQVACVVCQQSGHAAMFDIFRCFFLAQRIFRLVRANFSLCRLRSSYMCERCIDRLEVIEQLQEMRREFVDSFLHGCSIDGPTSTTGQPEQRSVVVTQALAGAAGPVLFPELAQQRSAAASQLMSQKMAVEKTSSEPNDGDPSTPKVAKYLLSVLTDSPIPQTQKDKRRNYSNLIKRLKGTTGEENGAKPTRLPADTEMPAAAPEGLVRLIRAPENSRSNTNATTESPTVGKGPPLERPRGGMRGRRAVRPRTVARSLSYRRILPKRWSTGTVVPTRQAVEPPTVEVPLPKPTSVVAATLKYGFEGVSAPTCGPETIATVAALPENVLEKKSARPALKDGHAGNRKLSGTPYMEIKEEVGGVSFFVLQSLPSQSGRGPATSITKVQMGDKKTNADQPTNNRPAPKNAVPDTVPLNSKGIPSALDAAMAPPISSSVSEVSDNLTTPGVASDGSLTVEAKEMSVDPVNAIKTELPDCRDALLWQKTVDSLVHGVDSPKHKAEGYEDNCADDDETIFNLQKMEVNMLENVVESFLKLEQERSPPGPMPSPSLPSNEPLQPDRSFESKADTSESAKDGPAAPCPQLSSISIPTQLPVSVAPATTCTLGFQTSVAPAVSQVQQIMFPNPEPLMMMGGVPIITPYVAPPMTSLVGLPLANGCIQTTTSQFQSVLQPVQFLSLDEAHK